MHSQRNSCIYLIAGIEILVCRQLIDNCLEFIGDHFHCGTLIDQLDRQNEWQAVSLLHQNALHSLHRTVFDAHFFADNQFLIWLNPLLAKVRAEKLSF